MKVEIRFKSNSKKPSGLAIVLARPDGPNPLASSLVESSRNEFISRLKSRFNEALLAKLHKQMAGLTRKDCPFANLPETSKGRWGEGMTAGKMKECVWVRPELVAQIDFLEWTEADHLRHSKFVGLREDKDPRHVVKEG